MMKSKKVQAGDSENEFDVDDPEEVGEYSEDKSTSTAAAKTLGKRRRPAKSTPVTKKKKPKVSDDEYKEEIRPAKERESKAKPPPPAPMLTSARGCERPTKVLKVVPEEEPEDDEDFEELNEEEDDDNVELSEEELNQVPKAKTVRKFTSGAFIVSKSDMCKAAPPVWQIDELEVLQKFIPILYGDKVFYKSIDIYRPFFSNFKEECYIAPVSVIKHTEEEHIIEFHKDKIKKDPELRSCQGKN
ncbi:unnamed protein product [Macrosiphum euphorbiae]|uniref:Uncharacterized protein n=1 Tax=Macrosiphum euphorbiae TaxID=13131 RepID=A0AAV0XWL6_9HEMI|nr:unnamed protein product [Macrosiphum euphorbiae]